MEKTRDTSCTPCRSEKGALEPGEIQGHLSNLGAGWSLNGAGHLYKAYAFKNFMGAMGFAHQIADLAEQQDHHPDLTISWGQCGVEIWTHKIQGLTENDFRLATKIEGLQKP